MVYYMEPVYFFFKMIQIFIYTNVHSLLKIYVHNPISLNTPEKSSQQILEIDEVITCISLLTDVVYN